MTKNKRRYVAVPHVVLQDARLTLPMLKVLMVLASHANKDGVCWPSLLTMGKALQMPRQTVADQIKKLAAIGYVALTQRYRDDGGRSSNVYQLVYGDEGDAVPKPVDKTLTKPNHEQTGIITTNAVAASELAVAATDVTVKTGLGRQELQDLSEPGSAVGAIPELTTKTTGLGVQDAREQSVAATVAASADGGATIADSPHDASGQNRATCPHPFAPQPAGVSEPVAASLAASGPGEDRSTQLNLFQMNESPPVIPPVGVDAVGDLFNLGESKGQENDASEAGLEGPADLDDGEDDDSDDGDDDHDAGGRPGLVDDQPVLSVRLGAEIAKLVAAIRVARVAEYDAAVQVDAQADDQADAQGGAPLAGQVLGLAAHQRALAAQAQLRQLKQPWARSHFYHTQLTKQRHARVRRKRRVQPFGQAVAVQGLAALLAISRAEVKRMMDYDPAFDNGPRPASLMELGYPPMGWRHYRRLLVGNCRRVPLPFVRIAKRLGIDNSKMRREYSRFHDYWANKMGQKHKPSWLLAWQYWLKNGLEWAIEREKYFKRSLRKKVAAVYGQKA